MNKETSPLGWDEQDTCNHYKCRCICELKRLGHSHVMTDAKAQWGLPTLITTTFISPPFFFFQTRAGPSMSPGDDRRHMAAEHAPLTLIYWPCTHMFLWHTKSSGCVPACVCYWTLTGHWLWTGFLCMCGWDVFLVWHMLGKYMCQQLLGMIVIEICPRVADYVLHALFSLCVCVWICSSSAGLCVIVIRTGQLRSFVFSPEALLGRLAD